MEQVTSASDKVSSTDAQEPSAPAQAPAPNPSDVQNFNVLLMQGKAQDKSALLSGMEWKGKKEEKSEKKSSNSTSTSSTSSSRLPPSASELQAQSFMAAFNQNLAPVNTSVSNPEDIAPKSRILQISTQIIDRIMVSNAALDSKQEVHIKFAQAVLPGTEVAISKTEGVLQVAFRTNVVESNTLLTANQGDLKQHLMDRLNLSTEKVQIRVRSEGEAASGQASADGRSRNRRYVIDEIEPEA